MGLLDIDAFHLLTTCISVYLFLDDDGKRNVDYNMPPQHSVASITMLPLYVIAAFRAAIASVVISTGAATVGRHTHSAPQTHTQIRHIHRLVLDDTRPLFHTRSVLQHLL
jgi:hypothetical protein